mmetsp:Transcript_1152/g.3807  ORF Transcript_1152/g.3807 Transcript_1152/m.3807 type:complete len:349 (+) Transcript_1152:86-1132(+)
MSVRACARLRPEARFASSLCPFTFALESRLCSRPCSLVRRPGVARAVVFVVRGLERRPSPWYRRTALFDAFLPLPFDLLTPASLVATATDAAMAAVRHGSDAACRTVGCGKAVEGAAALSWLLSAPPLHAANVCAPTIEREAERMASGTEASAGDDPAPTARAVVRPPAPPSAEVTSVVDVVSEYRTRLISSCSCRPCTVSASTAARTVPTVPGNSSMSLRIARGAQLAPRTDGSSCTYSDTDAGSLGSSNSSDTRDEGGRRVRPLGEATVIVDSCEAMSPAGELWSKTDRLIPSMVMIFFISRYSAALISLPLSPARARRSCACMSYMRMLAPRSILGRRTSSDSQK